MELNKKSLIKFGAGAIVSMGVGIIMKNAINYTTPETVKGVNKACLRIGQYVVTAMLCDSAIKKSDEIIDTVIKDVSNFVNTINNEEEIING